jgi:hypothetical protein
MMKFRRCAEHSLAALLVACVVLTPTQSAHAQSEKASAEALFADGRRLMSEGKNEQACIKFAASNKQDPSSGTLLNLGNCYEKLGRSASAWAAYAEAASRAQSANRDDHLRIAQKRVATLEPTLARVTVVVDAPTEGLVITRDGFAITSAEWGLAIPTDPSVHTYTAKAPGYDDWTITLNLNVDPAAESPTRANVTVPLLKKRPATAVHAESEPMKAPGVFWTPVRVLALSTGALGVVGLGVGGAFALSAKSTYKDSLVFCPTNQNLCTQQGLDARNSARSKGNIATGTMILGGGLAALGAVLWIVAPTANGNMRRSVGVAPMLDPTTSGLHIDGVW